MNEEQAIAYLQGLQAGGMQMGLERMERILSLCGDPQRRLRTVHIAGTNGKGSTARMIQQIGMAAGYRVGLFSSPAVTGLRDSIDVNGQAISAEDFARWVFTIKDHQPQMGEVGTCSEFETLTAVAFGWLSEQQTDFCVIECGLGGKEDATNVLPSPMAAVLCPISMDHTAILGDTVDAITRQKCGILKAGCSVVVAPTQSPESLGVIWEQAASLELTVHQPNLNSVTIEEDDGFGTAFIYDDMPIRLSLLGYHQVENALTAIETVRRLTPKGFAITADHIVRGLSNVQMPCRQEILSTHPLCLLDGAHNPSGIAALADTLKRLSSDGFVMVLGMLRDKDVDTCLQMLAPCCRRMICTAPPNPRALPAEELAQKAAAIGIDAIAADSPETALLRGEETADGTPLLVGGSLYLGALLRPLWKNRIKESKTP